MVKYGYILYACPTGPLADQIEHYFETTKKQVGPNTAHTYMPHCTLTGFFKDERSAAELYNTALAQSLAETASSKPTPPLTITELLISEKFHGLKLESDWLEKTAAQFKLNGDTPTRQEDIRLKSWLHLSLAYDFAPEQHESLAKIATELIDLQTPVGWDIRLYEREISQEWVLHASHSL